MKETETEDRERQRKMKTGSRRGTNRVQAGVGRPSDSPYTGARTIVESSPQERMKPSAVLHPWTAVTVG